MNPTKVLAYFNQISEAEDAVPRLRRFILDLAVRGKLVPQDLKDEPASELLKRVAAAKERAGRKERTTRPHIESRAPRADVARLPSGWAIATLSELVTILNGRAYKQSELLDKGTPVLRVGNLFTSDKWYYSDLRLDGDKYCDKGDLIFAWSASFGPFIWAGERVIYHYHIWKLPLHSEADFDKHYLYNFLLQRTREIKDAGHGISMIHMTKEKMEQIDVPVPPLAEQRRIVAKVDELMALCDKLEEARAEWEATRRRLTTASLARLKVPDPDPAVFSKHARLALDSIASLTARPDQVAEVRQTILSLAVRGKLVRQNPDDEPGSELLKRIYGSRKGKPAIASLHPSDLETELPRIPENWCWAVADELRANQDNAITDGPFGAQLKTAHYVDSPGFRVIRLQNIGAGVFRDEHRSYIDGGHFRRLAKHHIAAGDLVVAGLVDPRVRCCQVPLDIGPALVKADCYRFAVHAMFSPRFALDYLNSPVAQEFAAVHHHGMTLTRIGLGNFRRIPFPVPPLAEQHRIVAKVDELMALCERLEASLVCGEESRSQLLQAVLHEALERVGRLAA